MQKTVMDSSAASCCKTKLSANFSGLDAEAQRDSMFICPALKPKYIVALGMGSKPFLYLNSSPLLWQKPSRLKTYHLI